MSTDAAHSLGDALGVDLAAAATPDEPVEVEPRLHALQVGAHTGVGAAVAGGAGLPPRRARHAGHRPGGRRGADLAARGRGDRGAARAARRRRPTAGSGTWSSSTARRRPRRCGCSPCPRRSPGTWSGCCRRSAALMRTLRPAAAAAAGMPLPVARGARRRCPAGTGRCVTSTPCSPVPRASVRLVLTPERVVIAEARRTLDVAAGCTGSPSTASSSTGSSPPRPPAWRRRGGARGTRRSEPAWTRWPSRSPGSRSLRAPYLAGEPIGADALDDAGRAHRGRRSTDGRPARRARTGPPRRDAGAPVRFRLRAEPAAAAGPRARGRPQAARRRAARVGGRPAPGAQPAGGAAAVCRPRRPRAGRRRCG